LGDELIFQYLGLAEAACEDGGILLKNRKYQKPIVIYVLEIT
jgi:hypothetical protein